MMLKELFDAICAKQEAATTAQKVDIADPYRKHFLLGDKAFTIDIPPAARKHTILTLDDLIAAVELRDHTPVEGSLWHTTDRIVYVIDDEDRRETITMPLVFSEHWTIIAKLGHPLSQRDFVRLLRHELHGCVPDTLLPAVAKIEVATSSGQKNEINPGRERGTREFASELASSGEIPEHFTASVSVYANAGLRHLRAVRMSLDYTLPPKEITFRVEALPDELELAMQDAQADLHKLLQDAVQIPVFNGTP